VILDIKSPQPRYQYVTYLSIKKCTFRQLTKGAFLFVDRMFLNFYQNFNFFAFVHIFVALGNFGEGKVLVKMAETFGLGMRNYPKGMDKLSPPFTLYRA
jgi:hypothetical protein